MEHEMYGDVDVDGLPDDKRSSWYENDLQLAAELGKTLLERNLDLEAQLHDSQQLCSEQASEIDLLQKQVEVLRNVDDSRQRMYEDIDRSVHELEKTNSQYSKERKRDRESINRLTETVCTLEGRCEELQQLLEQRVREAEKRGRQEERQRTHSVPSLVGRTAMAETSETDYRNRYDCLGYPSVFSDTSSGKIQSWKEVDGLQKKVKNLKLQLTIEQNKRRSAEVELSALVADHKALIDRTTSMAASSRAAVATASVSTEDGVPILDHCSECVHSHGATRRGRRALDDPETELIEHDLDVLPQGGQLVRLKNGGSAYGSRESLNLIGLEADDATPNLEVCSAILASDITARMNQMSADAREDVTSRGRARSETKNNFSLLGEFEEQYRKLVVRYEELVEAKQFHSQRIATPSSDTSGGEGGCAAGGNDVVLRRPHNLALQPSSQLDSSSTGRRGLDNRSSPLDTIEGHFETGPPEYKQLFKEIFETLRRSVVYETTTSSDNSSVPAGNI